MKNFNQNKSGLALLQALMLTAFVGVAAGFIMSQSRLTDKTLLIPRIRSDMLFAESAFRNLAYMNGTYSSPFGAATATVNAASVNPWLARFESVLNYLCTPPTICKIEFQPSAPAAVGDKFQYDALSRTISTKIVYTGSNITVRPINISIIVPDHILTGAPFTCAGQPGGLATPFFRGFDGTNGNPVCTGWATYSVADGARCPDGEIMTTVGNTTMQITCTPLIAVPATTCAANQYISDINWPVLSGGVMNYSCVNRPSAFTYFGFTPVKIPF